MTIQTYFFSLLVKEKMNKVLYIILISLFSLTVISCSSTLHLVIDTDNGTVFDDNASPLTSGTTYKVTLSGSAKDSDGNTLGSDVVKYITP